MVPGRQLAHSAALTGTFSRAVRRPGRPIMPRNFNLLLVILVVLVAIGGVG